MRNKSPSKNRHGQHCILESLAVHKQIAAEHWPDVDLENVHVDFDLSGICAGMAYWKTGRVRINIDLLLGDTLDEMWRQTLPHELAHIIAARLMGRKQGHGGIWQQVMRKFGLDPDRTHGMEVEHLRRKMRTAPCRCDCKTWELTARRVNAMKRGRIYRCPDCKTNLKVIGALT